MLINGLRMNSSELLWNEVIYNNFGMRCRMCGFHRAINDAAEMQDHVVHEQMKIRQSLAKWALNQAQPSLGT